MNERRALRELATLVESAGDDAAVVDGHVLTTDMLHETTDFPDGTTRYTAGWRAVGASLSDVAAMGANPVAAVAAYGAPTFDGVSDFVAGAQAVCDAVGAEYVGGDLDTHEEFTVATTVLGDTENPVLRSGARPGDVVCVTGTLGRSAAAVRLFEQGVVERANELFRFTPRTEAGLALAPHATAMMDSSDGLARSLHQLAEASDCGVAIESPVPIDDAVYAVTENSAEAHELAVFFGEDFELVCTLAPDSVGAVESNTPLTPIGRVTEYESQEQEMTDSRVTLDGDAVPDRGYTHGLA